ncbi:MAG: M48 family metalloprotease [Actinomycetota bacterium]|nr:M48 family metalloprotease [Actinomycetota bacterium]
MSRTGPRRGHHYGAWRVLCAVPAVLASTCVVTILFSGLGRWTPPAVAGWLLTGPLVLLGPAERAAVRAQCRFRIPTSPEFEWLTSLGAWTKRRCAAGPGRFDWYVRDDPEPAVLAAGGRSIAVTTGFLRLLYDGALSHRQAVAVLLHEAGHHITGRCRYGLVVCWLSWPWQVIYRFSMRLGQLLPWAGAAMVFLPVVFVVAFVNVARQDAPTGKVVPVLALLLVLAIFVYPVVDAVVSRAGEHAADRYAHRLGAGDDLAAALQVITDRCQVSSWRRLRASHPSPRARLQRLTR